MKELSIEEKAARYDDAIKRVEDIKTGKCETTFMFTEGLFEHIFPELAESEDERIRKNIMIALMSMEDNLADFYSTHRTSQKELLAWLGKQGLQNLANSAKTCKDEQEPTDKVEPKFHEGDWVVISTTKGDRVVQIASVEYSKDGYPRYFTTDGRWFGNGTKARLLTDKDVEFTTIPESKAIVNKIKSWSEADNINYKRLLYFLDGGILMQDHNIELSIWMESLKERVQSQQKQEWSEDTQQWIDAIIKDYEEWYKVNKDHRATIQIEIDILKSLKERYTWKPSEEQLEALDDFIYSKYPNTERHGAAVKSLYQDLKKLREE